ncbi:pancreatic triacylglycerol lipase [Nephila pilipes]|uniref:Pancreatic triacylglycerol lipase n=1 Tax=Nephila pilipes TaxID=299642 RepID=A0A8X6QVW0_NEPPI|nr:pancreatic triacylglycerol lipase [Nephila pilipes]
MRIHYREMTPFSDVDFFHGARYQYLVTTDKELGEIKSVSLKWYSASRFNIFSNPKLYVEYVTVIPMNTIEASPRNMSNRAFCNKPDNGITPKTIATFHRSDNCLK